MTDIYRLRTSMGTGSSGGGDWRLFENRDAFMLEVVLALIEEAAHGHMRHSAYDPSWVKWRVANRWWERFTKRGREKETYVVQKVYAAEKLIDGEWVDLGPILVPPRVDWNIQP